MSAAPRLERITPEEYLKMEEAARFKSEYYDGLIIRMAGGTPEHNQISANAIIAVGQRIRGRGCRVYTSDQRVKEGAGSAFVYPDVTIVCGEPVFDGKSLVNPTVVFEVLSDSSKDRDRIDKFDLYRHIESVKQYALISQDRARVEIYTFLDNGSASITVANALAEEADVSSLGIKLPLAELYDLITLSPLPPDPEMVYSDGDEPKAD